MLPKVEPDPRGVNRAGTEIALHEKIRCNFAVVSAGGDTQAASVVLRVCRFLEDCKLQQIFLEAEHDSRRTCRRQLRGSPHSHARGAAGARRRTPSTLAPPTRDRGVVCSYVSAENDPHGHRLCGCPAADG